MAKATPTDVARAVVKETPLAMSVLNTQGLDVATANVWEEIMPPVINDPFAFNAFLKNLYNKILLQEIITGRYENPLSPLKGGNLTPFGDTLERVIFNPAKAISYFNTQDNILTPAKPDVMVEYIRVTRQDKYPISLPRPLVEQAFTGNNTFGEFMIGAMNTLYNGDSIDEFRLMKKIVVDMVKNNYIYTEQRGATGVDFTKQIINYTKYFRFPNTKYNMYSILNPDHPLETWVDPSNIVLLVRADVMTDIRVDVLAAAFNLSEVELNSNIIEVDEFGDSQVVAVICDRTWFQVRDSLYETAEFYRADDLSTKTYLHHWQTMTCSLFSKAVAITDPNVKQSVYTSDTPIADENSSEEVTIK